MNQHRSAHSLLRRLRRLAWPATAALTFLLGFYLGQGDDSAGGRAPPMAAPPALSVQPPAAARGEPADTADRAATPGPEPAGPGAAGEGWHARLERLEVVTRRGDTALAADLRERLLDDVRALAADGDVRDALARVEAYRDRNPHDPRVYLLHAKLQHMLGNFRESVAPLLDLLLFANEPDVVKRARAMLSELVRAREAELANTGDVDGLIRLFRGLTEQDPGFDGHRLRLAHWQLRAGRADAAERTLAQTGTVGVDPDARDDLAAAVRLARSGLPVEHRGGALHVRARLGGRPVTLLVDTGATTTAITRARAVALNAVPTGQVVQVNTANGVIESQVHRVADLSIGMLHLEHLPVLVLEGPLPRGVDGLLGMDVLSRFESVPGTRLRTGPR